MTEPENRPRLVDAEWLAPSHTAFDGAPAEVVKPKKEEFKSQLYRLGEDIVPFAFSIGVSIFVVALFLAFALKIFFWIV